MAEGTTMCDRKESGIRTAGRKPDQIGSYFVTEWKPLLAVTVSGLIYNIGLLAGPWFEGRLAQCLLDVFTGKKFYRYAAFGVRVCGSDRIRAGRALHQAVLCAPVCERYQPEHEAGALRESGT